MMTDEMFKRVGKETQDDALSKLSKKCVDLIDKSRSQMQKRYNGWDLANETYLGCTTPDVEDKKAREKKEPEKMVVPMTFAQTQSFAAFNFLLLQQNRTFYELRGTGPEDYIHDAEELLERDLRHNSWPVLLYQCLIDIPRFGLCVTDTKWQEEYVYVPTQRTVPPASFLGIEFRKGKLEWDYTKLLRYKGNEIRVISPYNFLPDPKVSLRDMQKGEFVAVDEELTDTQLKKLEDSKEVAGTEFVKPLQQGVLTENHWSPRLNTITPEGVSGSKATPHVKLITQMQIDIVPKDLEIGKEEVPIRYWVWIANMQRIIKLEPMGYLHSQFTVNVGEFTPDQHAEMGRGLAETIDYLQYTLTWLINSHISSIRKTIDSKFIYDPAGIDQKSLDSRTPYIPLRKNVSRSGVDRWIKQFQVVDATQNHMADADAINKLIQMVTGINDNAQGQYNSGRRSATESRAVTAGAASRLRMHAALSWWQCFNVQGQLMLANLRQGMDEQLWLAAIGEPPQDPMDAQKYVERFTRFKGTPEAIVQNEDFMVYDSTLPSEKGFIAQSMQEMFAAAVSNPETALALNLNLGKVVEESFRLRGIDNVEQFRMTPEEQMRMYARLRIAQGPEPAPATGGTNGNKTNPQQRVLQTRA
jgi:hypothetical protein